MTAFQGNAAAGRRLGKRLGVVHDPRTLMMLDLLPALPPVPEKSELSRGRPWPMLGNDDNGDCTYVTHGHRILAQERNSGQHELAVSEKQVLAAYYRHTGGRDEGAYMLDVANEQRRIGLGVEEDGSPHMVEAFVKVDHTDLRQVKAAIYLFGGVAGGLGLPVSAQSQGLRWDVTKGPDSEFGSWGGHSVFVNGYSREGLTFPSWAERHFMTNAFAHAYMDECYAFLSEDWLNGQHATRSGFKVDQLRAFLRELD